MKRQKERTTSLSRRRHRSKSININANSETTLALAADDPTKPHRSPHYRRNYVRYRTSASRSRSRENSKHIRSHLSIDYREKLFLLIFQTIALLHLCSMIYCHHCQSSLTVKYALVTWFLFNLLTFTCVQYDTQQIEHGRLQLGENPLLFLLWYGGLIGGGLALFLEKHQYLRSRIFAKRLRLIILCNTMWPFLVYIFYMCRLIEDTRAHYVL